MYHSQLFVSKNSALRDFNSLHGAVFAFNDEASLSGYQCVVFLLASLARNPGSGVMLPFFTSAIRTGSHENSIKAVVTGSADVLCLDCTVMEKLRRTNSGQELLSMLHPIPVPSSVHGGPAGLPTYMLSTPDGHLGLAARTQPKSLPKSGLLGMSFRIFGDIFFIDCLSTFA